MRCLCLSSILLVITSSAVRFSEATSNFESSLWKNGKQCTLASGADGRCIKLDACPRVRESSEDRACGTDKSADVCCQSHAEDFIERDYGRVAKRACNKYMDYIKWKNFGYVFGGQDARPKEFTFMAALGYGANVSDIKFHCGGSLISEQHVLTAAHCLFSADDGPVRYVLLGDLDINSTTDDAQPQYHRVRNVTVHPQYKRSSVYHDIAILHLDRPAIFTAWVQPACLDFGQLPADPEQTKFYATGWGYIDTNNNRATHMQEVELIEYVFERCRKVYLTNRRRLAMGLVETQMCAGTADDERKDTCQGDSGGPLSRTNDDIRYGRYKGYILVGVTSFGKLCGYTNAPGVYTRVEKYIPWIEAAVWPEEVAALGASPDVETKVQTEEKDMLTPFTSKPIEISSTVMTSMPLQSSTPMLQVQQAGTAHGQGQGTGQQIPNTFLIPESQTSSPSSQSSPDPTNSANSMYQTTRKPINLIDVHYFSDKR